MPTDPYWIEQRFPGRLSVSSRPRGDDWLEDELYHFKTQGVNVVVSLLETGESSELGLAKEQQLCETLGIVFTSFPVADYSVPSSPSAAKELACKIKALLFEGQSVLIHCRQGIGRSGILAAAVLTELGMTLADALSEISKARGILVPETDEQRKWLARHFGAA